MLKKTIIEADKFFAKLDLSMISTYSSSDNNCCMSCHTDDDLAYVYIKNKLDGYVEKDFAFRNWSSIHSILSGFYDGDENNLNIELQYNKDSFPVMMKIKNKHLKMNYYLQNHSFITKQQELDAEYKTKKFALNTLNVPGNVLDDNIVKDVSKMSSLTNEKYFRITLKDEGTFIAFGDEKMSSDNGSILISENNLIMGDSDGIFPVDYFISLYKSLSGDGFKVRIYKDKIVMVNENDKFLKVAIIRAKRL